MHQEEKTKQNSFTIFFLFFHHLASCNWKSFVSTRRNSILYKCNLLLVIIHLFSFCATRMNYLKAIAVSVTRQAFQYLVTEHIAVVVVCSIRKKRKYLWKAMIYKYTSNEEKQKKEIERERNRKSIVFSFLLFY